MKAILRLLAILTLGAALSGCVVAPIGPPHRGYVGVVVPPPVVDFDHIWVASVGVGHVDRRDRLDRGWTLAVESGLLREECAALFARWRDAGLCGTY